MAKSRKYTTEWHRRDVVARWRKSGLSQAEFCRHEGIPEHSLSAWKLGELRERGSQSGKPKRNLRSKPKSAGVEFAAIDEQVAVPTPVHARASFVPLVQNAVLRHNNIDGPVAEIRLAGCSVRVFPAADPETLRVILQAMKEFGAC